MLGERYVTCFYNVNHNHGSYNGQSQYNWGINKFYLHGGSEPLQEQLIKIMRLDADEVFNLNVTAFTPIPESVFEIESEEKLDK